MEWLSLMFGGGGGGRGWVEAALLVGLFWAALAHPDRIRSLTEFRLATLLLGVSMVAPVMVQLIMMGDPLRQPGLGRDVGTGAYELALPPLLGMLAVILGVDSVTPRSRFKKAEPNAAPDPAAR